MKKRMWKRIVALVLVLTMLAGDPSLAYAAQGAGDSSVTTEVSTEATAEEGTEQAGEDESSGHVAVPESEGETESEAESESEEESVPKSESESQSQAESQDEGEMSSEDLNGEGEDETTQAAPEGEETAAQETMVEETTAEETVTEEETTTELQQNQGSLNETAGVGNGTLAGDLSAGDLGLEKLPSGVNGGISTLALDGTSTTPYVISVKKENGSKSPTYAELAAYFTETLNYSIKMETFYEYSVEMTGNGKTLNLTNSLLSNTNNSGLSDGVYTVKQKKCGRLTEKVTYSDEIQVTVRTYCEFTLSVAGSDTVTTSDVVVTTENSTYNTIERTGDRLKVYVDQFPITLTAPKDAYLTLKPTITDSTQSVTITPSGEKLSAKLQYDSNVTSGNIVVAYVVDTTPHMIMGDVHPDATGMGTVSATFADGTALTNNTAYPGNEVTLTAVPNEGYEFVRWYQIVDGQRVRTANTEAKLDLVVTGEAHYEAMFTRIDTLNVAQNGMTFYSETELPSAFLEAKSGDTILLIANAILSKSVTIPAGVDFLLPYSASDTSITDSTSTEHPNANASYGETSKLVPASKNRYLLLTVADDVTLTVASGGRLVTGAVIHSASGGFSGQVGGAHSDIAMQGDAQIIVDGILSSCGYILGGKVIVNSGGKLYEPFIMGDFTGGTYTSAMYQSHGLCPFNLYTMQNITSDIVLNPNSQMLGYADVYTSGVAGWGAGHNKTCINYIAPTGLFATTDETVVTLTHDESKAIGGIIKATIRVENGVNFGPMNMEVAGVSISTSTLIFPVPYNITMILEGEGSVCNISSRFKILPGAEVYIEKGVTVNFIKEDNAVGGFLIYEGANMLRYSSNYPYPTAAQLTAAGYPQNGRVVVSGTLNMGDNTVLAGRIEAGSEDAVITVGSGVDLEETTIEGALYNEGTIKKTERANRTQYELKTYLISKNGWREVTAGTTYYGYDVNDTETLDSISYTYDLTNNTLNTDLGSGTGTATLDFEPDVVYQGSWVVPNVTFICECGQAHDAMTTLGASLPECTNRDGYTFGGWYTGNNGSGDKYTTVPKDEITVYAKWTANTYDINFDLAGGTGEFVSISATYNQPWTLPNQVPVRTGYKFLYWSTLVDGVDKHYTIDPAGENTYSDNLTATANGSVTLTAVWEAIPYTITFMPGDGAAAVEGQTRYYGDALNGTTSTRTGYRFGGWYTGENGTGTRYFSDGVDTVTAVTTMPAEDLILYAHWVLTPYQIVLDANGGVMAEGWNPYTFDIEDSKITLPVDITKTGYTFAGWTGEGVAGQVSVEIVPSTVIPNMAAGDDTLEYTAGYTPNTYTIRYDVNGGTGTIADQDGVVYDGTSNYITSAQPARKGYTFLGWAKSQTAAAQDYTAGQQLPDNLTAENGAAVTLYAVWSPNPYTITYYYKEGDKEEGSDPYTTVSWDCDAPVTAPEAPTKEGYTFVHWYYLSEDDQGISIRVPFFTGGVTMPAEDVTLYAAWTAETYTIQFTETGDVTFNDITEAYGTDISGQLPVDPTKAGHTFAGWVEADAESDEIVELPTAMPDYGDNGAVKIYQAAWTIESYTIQFVDVDGTELGGITAFYGEDLPDRLPADPTKTGYTFTGWRDADGDSVTLPATMPDYGENGAAYVITASWKADAYEVVLNPDGGSIEEENWLHDPNFDTYRGTYTIEAACVLPNPAKTGYTFDGWTATGITLEQKDGNWQIPAGSIGALTITAKWTANEYRVALDTVGGTLPEDQENSISVTFGTAYGALPTPTKEGYAFLGWYTVEQSGEAADSKHLVTAETMMSQVVTTLYAHWEIRSYTITFDSNGGSDVEAQTQAYGTKLSAPAEPARTGYTFTGWYRTKHADGTLADGFSFAADTTMPAEDMTLYAGWEAIRYELILNLAGGVYTDAAIGTILYTVETQPSEIVLPTAEQVTKEGYSLTGWAGMPDSEYMPARNVEVTARWTANSYGLILVLDGQDHTTVMVPYDTKLDHTFTTTIHAPAKTGHTFDGWYTEAEDGRQLFVEGCTVTMNMGMRIYARYDKNPYTIHFDGNTHTGGATASIQAHYDDNVTWPDSGYTKTGYTFDSWNTTPAGDGTGYRAGDTAEAPNLATGAAGDEQATLYAQWTANPYEVTFAAGFETDQTMDPQPMTYDVETGLRTNEFTRTGYTFAGWSYTAAGEQKTAADGASVKNLATGARGDTQVTLTARWTPIRYTVEYDLDGGEGTFTAFLVEYDKTWTTPETEPVKAGYDFAGWKIRVQDMTAETIYQAGAAVAAGQSADPDVAVTLVAQWTAQTYQILLDYGYDENGVAKKEEITVTYGQTYAYGTNGSNGVNAAPARPGYGFAGWYTDASLAEAGRLEVERAVVDTEYPTTLYAKWDATDYTINYENADGWTYSNPQGYSAVNLPLTLTVPARQGYTFLGWSYGADGQNKVEMVPVIKAGTIGNLTFTLMFRANEYTVVFDANYEGSTYDRVTQSFTYDEEKKALTSPGFEREGYTFLGWSTEKTAAKAVYKDKELVQNLTDVDGGNVELYAVWQANTYTFTFAPGFETEQIMASQTFTWDAGAGRLSLNTFEREGYTFAGWKAADGTVFADGQKIDKYTAVDGTEIALTAQWTKNEYTITLIPVGGAIDTAQLPGWTWVEEEQIYIRTYDVESDEILLPADGQIVKTGHTLSGWLSGGDAVTCVPAGSTGDKSYTAQWSEHSYTLVFHSGHEDDGATAEQTFTYTEEKALLANPFGREGYTFRGWATEAGSSNIIYGMNATVSKLTDENGKTIHLYAVWKVNSYQVALDANGGILPEGCAAPVIQGVKTYIESFDLPENTYTRTGYSFLGWSESRDVAEATYKDGQTGIVGLTATDGATVTLYAVWRLNSYTIVYEGLEEEGVTVGDAKDNPTGTDVTVEEETLSDPSRTGYTFSGWTGDGVTVDEETGVTTIDPEKAIESAEDGTITYTANWTPNQYTVTLNAGDGTFVSGPTMPIVVTYDSTFGEYTGAEDGAALPEPKRTGYSFAGWFVAPQSAVAVLADLADLPAGQVTADTRVNVSVLDDVVDGDSQLYAHWTANPYTVTFDFNNGTCEDPEIFADKSIIYDVIGWKLPETEPTRTGYHFDGWQAIVGGQTLTYKAGAAVDVNLATGAEGDDTATLTARWTANTYTVHFDGNGADGGSTADQSFRYDQVETALRRSGYTKTGYTFAGWNTAADGSGTAYTDGQPVQNLAAGAEGDEEVILYARWTANRYTVRFDGNGADDGSTADQSLAYDQEETALGLNGYTKTGYTFAGWNTAADGSGTGYTDGQSVQNLVTGAEDDDVVILYARWTANSYTIRFDGNGADRGSTADRTFYYDETGRALPANGYGRDGYTFVGWNTQADGGGATYDAGKVYAKLNLATGAQNDKEVTLYAKWQANTYTLLFTANGGSGQMDSQTLTYDEEARLSVNGFTRVGYTFLGWDTSAAAKVPAYPQTMVDGEALGALVRNLATSGQVRLYAIWQANEYDLTFRTNSPVEAAKDTVFAETQAVFDGTVVLPEDIPQISGYVFDGWYTAPVGGTKVLAATRLTTEGATYYAQWRIKNNTITLILEDCTMTGTEDWTVGEVNGVSQAAYRADYGTAIPVPPIPVKIGHTFLGWTTVKYGVEVEFTFEDTTTMPADSLTLYPVWQIKINTIRLVLDGGTNVDTAWNTTQDGLYAEYTAQYNTAVSAPADPQKEGYTFLGWYTDSTFTRKYNFTAMPGQDVTQVYAKWSINRYTVTFETLEGGSAVAPVTQDYHTQVSKPQAVPVRQGYRFTHWSLTDGGPEVTFPILMPEGGLTVYAVYDSYLDLLHAIDYTTLDDALTSEAEAAVLKQAREYFMLLNDAQKAAYTSQDADSIYAKHCEVLFDTIEKVAIRDMRQSVLDARKTTNEALSNVKVDDVTTGEQDQITVDQLATMFVYDENLAANPPLLEGMIQYNAYAIGMLNVEFMTALFAHDEIVSIVCDDDLISDVEQGREWKQHKLTGATIESAGTLGSDQFNIMLMIAWAALDPTADKEDFMNYLQTQMNTLQLDVLDGKGIWATVQAETPEGVQYEVTYFLEFYFQTHDLVYDLDGGVVPVDPETQQALNPATGQWNQTVTLTAPVKRGYTFTGWTAVDADGTTIVLTAVGDKAEFTMGKKDVTLKAQWQQNPYTVTLNPAGGSLAESVQAMWPQGVYTYTAETEAIHLPTAQQITAPAGYAFGGWYVQGAEADTAQMSVTLTPAKETYELADVVYVAHWIPLEYTLTLDLAQGTLSPEAVQAGGWTYDEEDQVYTVTYTVETDPAAITLPEAGDVTRIGYRFTGWDKTIPAALPAENLTITAQWQINRYTITFDTDGGTEIPVITQDYGTPVTAPADPVKTGCTFLGWADAQGSPVEIPAIMPAENVTLTAQWQINQYIIRFDTNGGSPVEALRQDYGTAVTTPDAPEKTGHTFVGWFVTQADAQAADQDKAVTLPARMPAENQTYYAGWRINRYTITFAETGDTAMAPITQDFATAVTAPADPEKTGYTFVGWFATQADAQAADRDKAVTLPAKMPAEDQTYYAGWQINRYTITFDTDGGTEIPAITQDYGTPVTAPADPEKTGYTFLGWVDAQGAPVEVPALMPAGDMTVKVRWQANQYTVTLDAAGGLIDGQATKEVTVTYDTQYGLPRAERAGYTFVGWFWSDGTKVENTDLVKITESGQTLTAHWAVGESYDIGYELDGGSWSAGASVPETYNVTTETFTLPIPVKTGYTFIGWTGSNGDVPQRTVTVSQGTTGDLSYTAHWEINGYTITFDTDGGNAIGAITQDYGTAVTAPEDPVKTGYTFVGWFASADAAGQADEAQAVQLPVQMPARNVTYYAGWKINRYTITFDTDGGNAVGAIKQDYATAVQAPADPEKVGYTFVGWFSTKAEALEADVHKAVTLPAQMPAQDTTYYAGWKINRYTITFVTGGGTEMSAITQDYATAVQAPAEPEKPGHTFVGWFATETEALEADVAKAVTLPVQMPARDTTYYAGWQINQYTITFAETGDSVIPAIRQEYDTAVTAPADPVKTGHTFVGWFASAEDAEAADVSKAVTLPTQMPAWNVTYYAGWQINQYTITFTETGDTTIPAITQDYGTAVTAPADPVKTGYTFTGWINAETGKAAAIPGRMPAQDMTLQATWQINTYSITFMDYTGRVQAVHTYEYGAAMDTAAAAVLEGYTFAGWYDEAGEGWLDVTGQAYFETMGGVAQTETMPAHDVTVYAKYTVNEYTFTFYIHSGEGVQVQEITQAYGTRIAAPEEPVREGYTFIGWFDADGKEYFAKVDGVAQPETVPAHDVVLQARMEVNARTITFMDGETQLGQISAAYGQAPGTMVAPEKTGYTFAGWVDAQGQPVTLPESMPDYDMVVYASWEANRYNVAFHAGGTGVTGVPETMEGLAYGQDYGLPETVPVRIGYRFLGWSLTATEQEALTVIRDLASANHATVTLYAMWEARTYTVTLDPAGGTVTPESIVVTYDQTFGELPVPEREGYTFNGWTDGATTYTTATQVKITEDLTLTALWTEKGDTPYIVVHHLQDLEGDGYTVDDTVELTGKTGSTAAATAGSYTGFRLNTDKSTMSGRIAADGSLVLNLYYDRIWYTVTWELGHTTVRETYRYEAIPVFKGEADYTTDHGAYTFTGWDKEPAAVTGSAVYTAQYTVDYEASINGVTYITLTKALSVAKSGETVRLDKDITLTEDLTIPAGVNLLIPCMDGDWGYNLVNKGKLKFNHDNPDTSGGTGLGKDAKLYRRLTIPAQVTVTVNGNILINSVSGRKTGGTAEMDITGGYGQIDLDGRIIVTDGGNLDCFGYVKGDGSVRAESGGSIGDLYIVRHWRGGSQALAMYQSTYKYGDPEDPDVRKIYPMNEYDCHNIETDVIVEYGASYDGNVKMCANAGGETGTAYYYTRFPQVNNTNGMIRLTSEGGYVVRSYDPATGRETYKIFGGADFAESTLNIAGMDLSTEEFLYPIDGDICFELYDGEYHFINDYKFLPGGGMTVYGGAALMIDYRVYVAFYDTFDDPQNTGDTQYPAGRGKCLLTIKEGAKFINGGTFGGSIYTESPDILIGEYPDWSITTLEANGYAPGNGNAPDTVAIFHDLYITRPGYDWRYGDVTLGEREKSIIWVGADYTGLMAALETVPEDLDIYSDETADPLEAVLDQIVFGLGLDQQDLVDQWTEDVLTCVAALALRSVTVILDAAGGTVTPESITVTYGEPYGTAEAPLPTPVYYGYTFLGWFDSDNVQIKDDTLMKKIVSEITLTAQWHMIPADYTAVDEAIASVPADMTGYTPESIRAVYDAVGAVDKTLGLADQEKVDAMARDILDAIAALERVQITVSFDSDGGEAIPMTLTLRYGDEYPYDELPIPEREGYDFIGWYTAREGGSQIREGSKVASVTDVVLYAKWREQAIVLEPGDYTAVNEAIAQIPGDLTPYTAASVNALQAAMDAVEYGLLEDRQADIDAWARHILEAIEALEYKTITVYFDANGGTCDVTSIQVTYAGAAADLPEASKQYHEFLGWFTAREGGVRVNASELTAKTENVTLYARYQLLPADYTEIDELMKDIPADLAPYSDKTVAALHAVLARIERGYTAERQTVVDGWADALRDAIEGLTYRTVTMTYDAQGGKVLPQNTTIRYGSTIDFLPVPERANHVFDGWFTEPDGGEPVTVGMVVTQVADFSIYAHWTQIDADYTRVYEALAMIPEDVEIYYTEESVAALMAAVDAVVYDLDASHQVEVDNYANAIEKAIRELEGKRVRITYEFNGGVVGSNPIRRNIRYGEKYILPSTSKEGYEFLGWYNESGERVTSDRRVSTLEAHTLYARWSDGNADYSGVEAAKGRIPADLSMYTEESVAALQAAVDAVVYGLTAEHQPEVDAMAAAIHEAVDGLTYKTITVALDAQGGTCEIGNILVTYHSAFGALPVPVRTDHEFLGWYTAVTGGVQVTETTVSDWTADATLYARWRYVTPGCDHGFISPECPSRHFTDIDRSLWYHLSVDYVVENSLMYGTGNTTFGPQETTTRAMIVAILYRMEGSPQVSGSCKFADVPAGAYYEQAVIWASSVGVVAGISDTEFAPDVPITREQMIAMMYRYAHYLDKDTTARAELSGFPDAAAVSAYARPAMEWAYAVGLISGTVDGMGRLILSPQGQTTRAEAAAFIHRFCTKIKS